MINNNEDILEELKIYKNWKPKTYENYKYAIQAYCKTQEKTFKQLIKEAEKDEETTPKPNKRRIKKRITQFQLAMIKKGVNNTTINNYTYKILTVYKYYDIETPSIEKLKNNNKETFQDILTPEEIKKALENTNTRMKAVITFAASSGLRMSDITRLTINNFIKATAEYHNSTDIIKVLQQLDKQKYIIPTWNIISQKTRINHITFCTPEATRFIIQMLKERLLKKEIRETDKLFDISPYTIKSNFRRINDRLDFGWVNSYRRFHIHGLRKFFGTTLTNNDMDFLSTEFLLGHTLKNVQSSYYFANPSKLKNKYMRYMKYLMFFDNVNYIDVVSNERRELEDLRAFKRESERRILDLEEMVNFLQTHIN